MLRKAAVLARAQIAVGLAHLIGLALTRTALTAGNQRKNADALSFPRRSIGAARRFYNSGKLMTWNQRMTMRPRPINARDIRPANSASLHPDQHFIFSPRRLRHILIPQIADAMQNVCLHFIHLIIMIQKKAGISSAPYFTPVAPLTTSNIVPYPPQSSP